MTLSYTFCETSVWKVKLSMGSLLLRPPHHPEQSATGWPCSYMSRVKYTCSTAGHERWSHGWWRGYAVDEDANADGLEQHVGREREARRARTLTRLWGQMKRDMTAKE